MPSTPSKQSTKTDQVRTQILDAARRCFARAGYHGTSIKTIAGEAGVRSPSILHYHYESKQAIFLEVMRRAVATIAERATQVGLKVDEGPRGVAGIQAFFDLLDEEDDLSPLLIECMAMGMRGQHTDELGALQAGLEGVVEEATRTLLGEGADRLPLTSNQLSAAIVDLLTGHAIRSRLTSDREVLRRQRDGVLTLLGLVKPTAHDQTEEDHGPAT
jgi:AcrR family transcriptional regulator